MYFTKAIIIDDARHFINNDTQQYDIIIYDTFLSESVPEHLLTKEGFQNIHNLLKDGGMILTNFYGAIEGYDGRAARSVLKTFRNSDFKTKILATPGLESSRNLIFIASKKDLLFNNTRFESINFSEIENLDYLMLPLDNLDMNGIEVLTDDKPKLSKLYNKIANQWKVNYNEYYKRNFMSK